MSDLTFPTLKALQWSVQRTAIWPVDVQTSRSGYEFRLQSQPFPRWRWDLRYSFLSDDRSAGVSELQSLLGFWMHHRGALDDFWYVDPNDNAAVDQEIGIGDGATTVFFARRPFRPDSGAYELVQGVSWSGVNVNGVPVMSIPEINHVMVRLPVAPAVGASVSASFTWKYRVRFEGADLSTDQFAHQLFDLRKISLLSLLWNGSTGVSGDAW